MRKVLIVAGGTGGHIFPAIAFGEWLKARQKAGSVTYLSGSRPLEVEIYRSQNIEPLQLPLVGSPLGGSSAFQVWNRCLDLLRAFFRTRKIFRQERPGICFLFGGYVSLMPFLWSRFLRIPVVMHEQNAQAGKMTRLASRMGTPVAAGWRECRGIRGSFTTVGIPVRPLRRMARRDAADILGVKAGDDDLVIGVIGGSLGSVSLNALPQKMARDTEAGKRRRIFLILGDNPGNPPVPSTQYVGKQWDMTPFYSLIDGAICRAGASTLAELAAYGIPALAVPWRGAADGHQEANARCFAAMTANPVWLESGEEDPEDAFSKLLELCERRKTERDTDLFDGDGASSALWQAGCSCPR